MCIILSVNFQHGVNVRLGQLGLSSLRSWWVIIHVFTWITEVETIERQTRSSYGCRPKSMSAGLGCGLGCMLALCVAQLCWSCSMRLVALYNSYSIAFSCSIDLMPIQLPHNWLIRQITCAILLVCRNCRRSQCRLCSMSRWAFSSEWWNTWSMQNCWVKHLNATIQYGVLRSWTDLLAYFHQHCLVELVLEIANYLFNIFIHLFSMWSARSNERNPKNI